LPKRTGKLKIPPIRIGNETTTALELTVTEQTTTNSQAEDQKAIIELSLNKESAYLEEEVILNLKLYYPPEVMGVSFEKPVASFDDTQIRLLNEEQYTSQRAGVEYQVLEQIYGLSAYQTGKLTVSGAKFRGQTGRHSPFNSLFRDPFISSMKPRRIVHGESNRVSLKILPVPKSFTGDHWLPAKNLQIVERGPDGQEPLIAGKPITRNIMILADGLTSNQLPDLDLSTPAGIKQYPEQPKLSDRPTRTGYSGVLQQSLTLIATEPGRYQLPAVTIPWWNTETHKQETARLPARELEFLPNPGMAASGPLKTPQAQSEPPISEPEEEHQSLAQDKGGSYLTWILGLAWLATLFAWWYSHRRKSSRSKSTQSAPDISSPNQQQTLMIVQEQLDNAYTTQDPIAARNAWLSWAQLAWPDNPPHNLSRLSKRCNSNISAAVNALERALYSPNEESTWSAYPVLELIQAKPTERISCSKERDLLVPLNPNPHF
jgi:hypothetical protein